MEEPRHLRRRERGWHHESVRHGLAARGVETGRKPRPFTKEERKGLKMMAERLDKPTWWEKKISKYHDDVVAGKYGEPVSERLVSSGWLDGVQLPQFKLIRNDETITVRIDESGVFQETKGGGWARIDPLKR